MEKTKSRILVVDDEQDLCDILQYNLETEGYIADTANSAEEALLLPLTDYDMTRSMGKWNFGRERTSWYSSTISPL